MSTSLSKLSKTIYLTDVRVYKGRYAYLRCNTTPSDGGHLLAFSNGADQTVVTCEERVDRVEHTGIEAWYKLIEFRLPTPFQTPGFIAAITTSLSDAGLNVLVISSFVSDYALVHEDRVDEAADALRNRGFKL